MKQDKKKTEEEKLEIKEIDSISEKSKIIESKKLTEDTKSLLKYFEDVAEYEKRPTTKPLHVDTLASKFASVYEKLRRVIDWKEEHLIRRTAIERSLKRRLISKLSGITFLQQVSAESMAKPFVLELIRSGYFPNDRVSAEKVDAVQKVLTKYLYVLSNSFSADQENSVDIKTKVQFYNWFLEIAACEIEEVMSPAFQENGLINFMTKVIASRIEIISEEPFSEDDKYLFTYINVQKALFNLDNPIVTYNLIKYKYSEWIIDNNLSLEDFAKKIQIIWKDITDLLDNECNSKFYNLCERYDASYLILYDVLKSLSKRNSLDLMSIFSDWNFLEKEIKKVYDTRISTQKARLRRSAIYSTASMFLAGGVMLIFVEGPLAKLVHGNFSLIAMIVDLAIPSLMMLFLVTLIRLPGKKNYKLLKEEVQNVIYNQSEIITYEVNLKKNKHHIRNLIFAFFYLIGTIISFGAVFFIFKIAKVPWTSLYIDTANIAIVVFTALVIKQRSKEVTMEETAKFGDFLLDIFSIPLANLGRWLSEKWKEYNFVSVFFTAVVDMPIVTIVELIEDWRNFLKEKKAEIH